MALSFLSNQTQKWSVGIDLGPEHVKLVCLAKRQNGYELMAHGFFNRTNLKGIRAALKNSAIRSGDIRVSFEDRSTKVQKITLPGKIPEEELDEMVKWTLKDALKTPLENFSLRYQLLSEKPEEKGLPYVVLAVENEKMKQHLAYLKELGLRKPSIVEPHICAVTHNVIHSHTPKPTDRYALIDFGETQALFSVISPKGLLFARTLSGASGYALTVQIGRDLGVNAEEAERCKTLASDILPGQKEKVIGTIGQFFSKLCIEIQHSMDTYQVLYQTEPVTHLLLTGGGALLNGLREHLEQTLKIPTSILDTFKNIDTKRFETANLNAKKVFYGVAVGLAL